MAYSSTLFNEIKLAPTLDLYTRMSAMTTGRATPVFFDETKAHVYNSAFHKSMNFYGRQFPAATRFHPYLQTPLHEPAFLCPYCVISKSLHIYHYKLNCNLDHQEPFSELKKTRPPIVLTFGNVAPSSPQLKAIEVRAKKVGLEATDFENVFQFNWGDRRHVQIMYNDLNNLEITCHGHNRLKGNFLAREGAVGAAELLRMKRSKTTADGYVEH